MDNASYFIQNKALFGSFPKQEHITELEENQVRNFIDLTCDDETNITKYTTKYNYYNFQIKDRKVPLNIQDFVVFIKRIVKLIRNLPPGDKVYIHCRAGHSRSSLVVSCILTIINNIDIKTAINLTREFHNKRKNLKEKWKKIAHLSQVQLRFLQKIFDNIFFFRAYKNTNLTYGFSNYSNHKIKVNNIGTFLNGQVAYNALKDPSDKKFINKQLKVKTTYESNQLSKDKYITVFCKYELMKKIIELKVEQHDEVKHNLLKTGFTKLVYNNKNDYYFGIGDGSGKNILGRILMDIRNKYIEMLI